LHPQAIAHVGRTKRSGGPEAAAVGGAAGADQ
jgi:hypothetical protein